MRPDRPESLDYIRAIVQAQELAHEKRKAEIEKASRRRVVLLVVVGTVCLFSIIARAFL